MSVEPAEFVRWVGSGEAPAELVDETLALTWQLQVEHAVLSNDSGERAMVRGGRDGIRFDLEVAPATDRIYLIVDVDNGPRRFGRLEWHTHPVATGPSDHDRDVLARLQQDSSSVYELGGEIHGTIYGVGKGKPRHPGESLGEG